MVLINISSMVKDALVTENLWFWHYRHEWVKDSYGVGVPLLYLITRILVA